MRTEREKKIEKEFEQLIRTSLSQSSQLISNINLANLLIPWMHNNVVNNLGDISEANRVELTNPFKEIYQNITIVQEGLAKLYTLYDEDPATYRSLVDTHLAENPTIIDEVEKRFS